MYDGLAPIVKQTIDLAWQVWTRKARLDVLSWSQLASETPHGECPVYSSSSGKLELHAMHGREIDEDPQALDDHEVLLICSPAVVLSGNADGKEYEKQRVVKKAVVWLG